MGAMKWRWFLVLSLFSVVTIAFGSAGACNGNNSGGCRENADCEAAEYCEKETGDCGGVGECLPIPLICPDVWNPVCGCDGFTYGNACEAGAAGINIASEGECPPTPCSDNGGCETGEYCGKEVGDCGGSGECLPMPLVCPDVWNPVCGCDGLTYGNACEVALAGVNVASTGECPQPSCTANTDCAVTEYCEKAVNGCDGVGVCQSMPLACPDVWDPVCGCDGSTYGNACYAALAGVNVASQGECPVPTCTSNSDCSTGEYCGKGSANCDGEGECQPMPLFCPDVWNPVCGCDGFTYGNACEAGAAGINIASEGECPPPPCSDNNACNSGEYCEKTAGDCGGSGECQPMPLACPDVWNPVCGCDGSTYDNACYAALAGVNVASTGECTTSGCTVNAECMQGLYCMKATGDCNGAGECTAYPSMCFDYRDPVCGCDGQTYTNACYAAVVNVNIASAGECP